MSAILWIILLPAALYLLEKMGLRVELKGVGHVRSQSLQRNTHFRKGDRIQLTLSM